MWSYTLLTWWKAEKLQAPFVVSRRPGESLDRDLTSGVSQEESKQRLDNGFELFSPQLIVQIHDCWQRHTEEVKGKAIDFSDHQQTCLKAKRTQDFIKALTHFVFLIGRNFLPLENDHIFGLRHINR